MSLTITTLIGDVAPLVREIGKSTGLERILRIFSSFFHVVLLNLFEISKIAYLFQGYRFQLYSFLFEVTSTVPWGVYIIGELVKTLNSWTRRRDGTINRKLADLVEYKVPASEKPRNGIVSKDVVIDDQTNVWVRIYSHSETSKSQSKKDSSFELYPVSTTKRPVLIYYHGGGFGVLCANQINIDDLCRRLARNCDMVVVSVNYKRAPEYPYPTAYDDSFKALKWLQSPESKAHLPPSADIAQCFLAGDSAGGNIAHFMACRAAENAEGLPQLRVRGVILLQPFFGSEQRTPSETALANVPLISLDAVDWHWKAFLPVGADRDHPACNVFGPNARDISLLPLPPVFLVTGTLDLLIDHQMSYASRMREMGKSIVVKNYYGGVHGFFFFAPVCTKISLECLAHVKEFIRSNLDEKRRS